MKILYLTTRDLSNPRTGADVRASKVQEYLSQYNEIHSVFFAKENSNLLLKNRHLLNYPSTKCFVPFSFNFYKIVANLISKIKFDVIYVSGIGAGTYGLFASKIFKVPLIFDDHNVEHELIKATGNFFEYMFSYITEKKLCNDASMVILTSQIDKSKLSKWIKNRDFILSNCYDGKIYYPKKNEGQNYEYTVLFFGNMAYKPNRDAAEIICDEIAPAVENVRKDISFHIVGPNSERIVTSCSSNVKVIGFVENISSYIRMSDVVICPLLEGSGTRFKIIESLASGKPVISTAKGAEGWPSLWTNLIRAEIVDFPQRIIDKCTKENFDLKELKKYRNYSWKKQVEMLNFELRNIEDKQNKVD